MSPNLINFPTLNAECHDTEARSLKKINDLQYQVMSTLAALGKPGGAMVGRTDYIYSIIYITPVGADLLDVACYNPTDVDVWVMIFTTPPSNGMRPQFLVRVYAHNHAYYEAMSSVASSSGGRFWVAVSSAENLLSLNSASVFLAVRHS